MLGLQSLSKKYGTRRSLRLAVACVRGVYEVVKHELRPDIHREKQLGWDYKMGGAESLRISREGQQF